MTVLLFRADLLPPPPADCHLRPVYELLCIKWRYQEAIIGGHEQAVLRVQILGHYQAVSALRTTSRLFHAILWRYGCPLTALGRTAVKAWYDRNRRHFSKHRAHGNIKRRPVLHAAPDALARQTACAGTAALWDIALRSCSHIYYSGRPPE